MEEATLRPATRADAEDVLRLYRSCIGVGDCLWREEYPDREDIDADLDGGWLYLWRRDGALMGAVSLLPDDDMEHLALPFRFDGKPCVLCRLCVRPSEQSHGLGAVMLAACERQAAALGYGVVHLLVDLRQHTARRLYDRDGYREVAQVSLYGHEFTAMEKRL